MSYNKHRNIRTTLDGMSFQSRLEAKLLPEYKLRQKANDIAWFIRQPRFDLPGGIIYKADYLAVFKESVVDIEIFVNKITPKTLSKIEIIQQNYPVKLKIKPTDRYNKLDEKQIEGGIKYYLKRPMFDIPPAKFFCDALVFYGGKDLEIVDAKGVETDVFKMKKKLTEEKYPIEIKLIKKRRR